jgi:hypothetical protein
MTFKEKVLYHQIHPFKLLVDISSGFGSLYPLWEHELTLALVVMLVPPPIASFLVMRYVNLEPYRQSPVGRYLGRYMTPTAQAVRFVGMLMMALGAWFHVWWLIPVGAVVILAAWLRGVLVPR